MLPATQFQKRFLAAEPAAAALLFRRAAPQSVLQRKVPVRSPAGCGIPPPPQTAQKYGCQLPTGFRRHRHPAKSPRCFAGCSDGSTASHPEHCIARNYSRCFPEPSGTAINPACKRHGFPESRFQSENRSFPILRSAPPHNPANSCRHPSAPVKGGSRGVLSCCNRKRHLSVR